MTHCPLGTTTVKGVESQPRKARPSRVVTAEGWPAAVCILHVKQKSDSSVPFANRIGRQRQEGQSRGFNGRLRRTGGERPAALGQLAVDELLNTNVIQLLSVAHALGSRGESPDCQIS
jgi:hypothetical protein